jgi:hypothetical protein
VCYSGFCIYINVVEINRQAAALVLLSPSHHKSQGTTRQTPQTNAGLTLIIPLRTLNQHPIPGLQLRIAVRRSLRPKTLTQDESLNPQVPPFDIFRDTIAASLLLILGVSFVYYEHKIWITELRLRNNYLNATVNRKDEPAEVKERSLLPEKPQGGLHAGH